MYSFTVLPCPNYCGFIGSLEVRPLQSCTIFFFQVLFAALVPLPFVPVPCISLFHGLCNTLLPVTPKDKIPEKMIFFSYSSFYFWHLLQFWEPYVLNICILDDIYRASQLFLPGSRGTPGEGECLSDSDRVLSFSR